MVAKKEILSLLGITPAIYPFVTVLTEVIWPHEEREKIRGRNVVLETGSVLLRHILYAITELASVFTRELE